MSRSAHCEHHEDTSTRPEAEDELADVVITAYLMAHYLGSDLDAALSRKAEKIFTRGWREPAL